MYVTAFVAVGSSAQRLNGNDVDINGLHFRGRKVSRDHFVAKRRLITAFGHSKRSLMQGRTNIKRVPNSRPPAFAKNYPYVTRTNFQPRT